MRTIDYPEFNPYDIRDAFFEFLLTLMKNYNKYWVTLYSYIEQNKEVVNL